MPTQEKVDDGRGAKIAAGRRQDACSLTEYRGLTVQQLSRPAQAAQGGVGASTRSSRTGWPRLADRGVGPRRARRRTSRARPGWCSPRTTRSRRQGAARRSPGPTRRSRSRPASSRARCCRRPSSRRWPTCRRARRSAPARRRPPGPAGAAGRPAARPQRELVYVLEQRGSAPPSRRRRSSAGAAKRGAVARPRSGAAASAEPRQRTAARSRRRRGVRPECEPPEPAGERGEAWQGSPSAHARKEIRHGHDVEQIAEELDKLTLLEAAQLSKLLAGEVGRVRGRAGGGRRHAGRRRRRPAVPRGRGEDGVRRHPHARPARRRSRSSRSSAS